MNRVVDVHDDMGHLPPHARRGCEIMRDAIAKVGADHGASAELFAGLISTMYSQSDMYIDNMHKLHIAGQVTPQVHNREIDGFLAMSAMITTTAAHLAGLEPTVSQPIMDKMYATHRRAAMLANTGVELH